MSSTKLPLFLVALLLTACDSDSTTPGEIEVGTRYSGDYGDCDPAQIDPLPTAADDAENGEMLWCDAEGWTEEACLGTSSLFDGARHELGHPDGYSVEQVQCGFMWLDSACCAHVDIDQNDTGSTVAGR